MIHSHQEKTICPKMGKNNVAPASHPAGLLDLRGQSAQLHSIGAFAPTLGGSFRCPGGVQRHAWDSGDRGQVAVPGTQIDVKTQRGV